MNQNQISESKINHSDLEEDVKAEESAGGDDGKHHGVLLRHGLRLLPRLLVILLLGAVRADGAVGPDEDGEEGHHHQAAVRNHHPFR